MDKLPSINKKDEGAITDKNFETVTNENQDKMEKNTNYFDNPTISGITVDKTACNVQDTIANQKQPNNLSNKYQGNVQLNDNVHYLKNVEDQGRCDDNRDTIETPSVGSINNSLSQLLVYNSSSSSGSRDSEPDSVSSSESEDNLNVESCSKSPQKPISFTQPRVHNESNCSSNNLSYSSESDESSDDDNAAEVGAKCDTKKSVEKKPIVEQGFDNLPPVDISKLSLSVKTEDCIEIGKVINIVEQLVVIESLPNTPACDLDTLLFINKGESALGHIFDVMGNVSHPSYVVRFNSKEDICVKGVTKGMPVYTAPNTEHCKFVFVKDLMQKKGTDASWLDDSEVPDECLSVSEDEVDVENEEKPERSGVRRKRKHAGISKHKIFEATMNFKNKLDTARHKMRDPVEQTSKQTNQVTHQQPYYYMAPVNTVAPIRQPCGTSFAPFPTFVTPPPPFNYMHPAMMNFTPFANQFRPGLPQFQPAPQPYPPGTQQYQPNPQQFVPPTFCPPHMPPLPPMPSHMMPQTQTLQRFTGNISMLPAPTMLPLNMSPPKLQPHTSKPTKTPNHSYNGGVVPKAQTNQTQKNRNRTLYNVQPVQVDYPQPYPPNLGLPSSNMPPPFATNMALPSMPPPPFGPPMQTWSFNLPPNQPPNVGNYRCASRPFKKH